MFLFQDSLWDQSSVAEFADAPSIQWWTEDLKRICDVG